MMVCKRIKRPMKVNICVTISMYVGKVDMSAPKDESWAQEMIYVW